MIYKTIWVIGLFVLFSLSSEAQHTFKNPILPGAYPDPSICKVGDDYYVSNSSFEYFPGIPIWHSKDLVHWEQIGFGIHKKNQFNFDGIASSAGAWAGTIRYHEGTFYLPLTWVDWRMKVGFKNVILTAKDPKGSWSNPYTITDTIWGIDPALFFDDNGKSYWLMNHPAVGFKHEGASSIMLQEIDLNTMKLVGTPSFIGRGAMLDSKYPEGPKMFKKDGYYYLMIAEGGTGIFHAVTISRSRKIEGPYENYEGNPILSHRNMGYTASIINTGHADMVQTDQGEWWLVCLASRPLGGEHNILGRETFLTPVKWDKDQWPIINPGVGQVKLEERIPNLPMFETKTLQSRDEFEDKELPTNWAMIRTPSNFYTIENGKLNMKLLPEVLSKISAPAFLGQRLQSPNGEFSTKFSFVPKSENEEAGMVIYKSEKANLKYTLIKKGQEDYLQVLSRKDSFEVILARQKIDSKLPVFLKVTQEQNKFSFYYNQDGKNWQKMYLNFNGALFSVEESGGYMGTFIGIYGSSNGKPTKNIATFDWFEYKSNP